MELPTATDERDASPQSNIDENIAGSQVPNNRQSGRARRKPELFSSQSHLGSSKRKRTASGREDDSNASQSEEAEAGDDDEGEPSEEDEDEDEDDGEAEADEEELKERRRRQKQSANKKEKVGKQAKGKRAAKKPKVTNGISRELAIRPSVNGKRAPTKPKKSRARPSGLVTEEEGLFGMLLSLVRRGMTPKLTVCL